MKPIANSEETIDGLKTQILIQNYADRVFVLVTQLGKVGCLVREQFFELSSLEPSSQSPPLASCYKLL